MVINKIDKVNKIDWNPPKNWEDFSDLQAIYRFQINYTFLGYQYATFLHFISSQFQILEFLIFNPSY